MEKYTEKQKLAAVEDYFSGTLGLKIVASRHGIHESSLRKLVAAYRSHGSSGVKVKVRRLHSAEFKLEVILRKRKDELSARQTAGLFDIRNLAMIGEWERAYDQGEVAGLAPYKPGLLRKTLMNPASVPNPMPAKDDERTKEDLLNELGQLRMENAYLKKLEALVQVKRVSAQKKKR